MGDRGRLVIPAEIRAAGGLDEGTRLIVVPTDSGLVLMTRPQLRKRVRDDLAGVDLVDSLLAERRAAAHDEDS